MFWLAWKDVGMYLSVSDILWRFRVFMRLLLYSSHVITTLKIRRLSLFHIEIFYSDHHFFIFK